jgi:hypothetical protein
MTRSGGPLSPRKIFSSIAVASALLLTTTGCSISHNIASHQDYAPSDGSQSQVGDLKIRNAFVLVKDGKAALFASVVNSGLEDLSATIQYRDVTGADANVPFPVFAGEKLDLGYSGNAPILLNVDTKPGELVDVKLLDGVNPGALLHVPVLDSSNPTYADLLDSF